MEWILVSLASLLAGFVDAIVGGGGLILLPALFATFPSAPPATLLGTNKSASVWGTTMATWQYSRRVQMRWRAMLPATAAGFAGAFAGAWAVTVVSPDFLRKLLPLVLLAVLLYTLAKKDLGRHHTPHLTERAEAAAACAIGLSVGFYDGFFGPGTGSFFVFLFVRLLGYDFLNASASAKLLTSRPTSLHSSCLPPRAMCGGTLRCRWLWPTWWAVCLAHTWPSSTARGLCAGSSSWWSVHSSSRPGTTASCADLSPP